MAVRPVTISRDVGIQDFSLVKFAWDTMTDDTNDTGEPIKFSEWADRTVQVIGTFGAGGNLQWQGSNDKTNWFPLTDPQGTDIGIGSAGLKAISEITLWARPAVTAGDGTTDLDVFLLVRRPNNMRT